MSNSNRIWCFPNVAAFLPAFHVEVLVWVPFVPHGELLIQVDIVARFDYGATRTSNITAVVESQHDPCLAPLTLTQVALFEPASLKKLSAR